MTHISSETDLTTFKKLHIKILGYGSQGRAQVLNLRDEGVRVTVAASPGKIRRNRLG